MTNLKLYIFAILFAFISSIGCRSIPSVSQERQVVFSDSKPWIQIPGVSANEYIAGFENTVAEALECGYSERLLTLGTRETFDESNPEFMTTPTPMWSSQYDIGSSSTGWNLFVSKMSLERFVERAVERGCNFSDITVLYTHTTWSGTTFQVVIKEHFTL